MTDEPKPLTDKELDLIEGSGAWNTLGYSTGELILRLVAEVRRLRAENDERIRRFGWIDTITDEEQEMLALSLAASRGREKRASP